MSAAKVCAQPGCPNVQPCIAHARPGPRQRGYDRAYEKRRAADLRDLQANPGKPCPWCGTPMHAGMALDWDHTKGGLTCARCNRQDGGRRSHDRY